MLIHSLPEVAGKRASLQRGGKGKRIPASEASPGIRWNCFPGRVKHGGMKWTLPCPPGHGHRERLRMPVSVVTVDSPVTDSRCR